MIAWALANYRLVIGGAVLILFVGIMSFLVISRERLKTEIATLEAKSMVLVSVNEAYKGQIEAQNEAVNGLQRLATQREALATEAVSGAKIQYEAMAKQADKVKGSSPGDSDLCKAAQILIERTVLGDK